MTRAVVVCAAVLATCIATSNSAQNLAPGEIVSAGQDTYRTRVISDAIDKPLDIDVADTHAMRLASEHCAKTKKTMIVKDKTIDMGYGYTLTWSCRPPQLNSAHLAPGRVGRVGQGTYKLRDTSEPVSLAETRAIKRADEYCTRKKQTMVFKEEAFDTELGLTLTWSCVTRQQAPVDR